MASLWYYRAGKHKHGPFTSEELRNLVRTGKLQTSHFVRRGADGEWYEARTVRGLFDASSANVGDAAFAPRHTHAQTVKTVAPEFSAKVGAPEAIASRGNAEQRGASNRIRLFAWVTLCAVLILLTITAAGLIFSSWFSALPEGFDLYAGRWSVEHDNHTLLFWLTRSSESPESLLIYAAIPHDAPPTAQIMYRPVACKVDMTSNPIEIHVNNEVNSVFRITPVTRSRIRVQDLDSLPPVEFPVAQLNSFGIATLNNTTVPPYTFPSIALAFELHLEEKPEEPEHHSTPDRNKQESGRNFTSASDGAQPIEPRDSPVRTTKEVSVRQWYLTDSLPTFDLMHTRGPLQLTEELVEKGWKFLVVECHVPADQVAERIETGWRFQFKPSYFKVITSDGETFLGDGLKIGAEFERNVQSSVEHEEMLDSFDRTVFFALDVKNVVEGEVQLQFKLGPPIPLTAANRRLEKKPANDAEENDENASDEDAIPQQMTDLRVWNWTDQGQSHVQEARFLDLCDLAVRLIQSDASVLGVPFTNFSEQDRNFITEKAGWPLFVRDEATLYPHNAIISFDEKQMLLHVGVWIESGSGLDEGETFAIRTNEGQLLVNDRTIEAKGVLFCDRTESTPIAHLWTFEVADTTLDRLADVRFQFRAQTPVKLPRLRPLNLVAGEKRA